ncbi:MAG: methylenetetrahydrofolate reductase, partial [Phormidesmis sp.]
IDRLATAKDPLHEGMKIAAEQVQAASQLCQGVHMMAVRREDLIPQILEMAGVEPQKQRQVVNTLSTVR